MTRKNEQERFMSYITERQTHESRMAVADFLRKYADRYHNSDFISSDPVQFPHRYHFKADIEISAFLTAFLSFGARPQILKAAERLDSIMNRQPLQYVLSGNWKIDFCGEESFYRTVSKNKAETTSASSASFSAASQRWFLISRFFLKSYSRNSLFSFKRS